MEQEAVKFWAKNNYSHTAVRELFLTMYKTLNPKSKSKDVDEMMARFDRTNRSEYDPNNRHRVVWSVGIQFTPHGTVKKIPV